MFSMERENIGQRKRGLEVLGLRVVLLCVESEGDVWSKVLEVNKPCGVMKEACCGQSGRIKQSPIHEEACCDGDASMAVVGVMGRGEVGTEIREGGL